MQWVSRYGAHLQVLKHCHPGKNPAAFGGLRKFEFCYLVCRQVFEVLAGEIDRTFACARIAADRHHQGRFSSAVGANQSDDFPLVDIEGPALRGNNPAVASCDARHSEEWGDHSPSSASTLAPSLSATPR